MDEVAEVLTSRDATAVELRQNSPFAGVLSQETRSRVLDAFAEHWQIEHRHDRRSHGAPTSTRQRTDA